MNFPTYSCNEEELYFLHLLFYPRIQPEFQKHRFSIEPEKSYDSFILSVYYWLVGFDFKIHPIRSKQEFFMGLHSLLLQRGFEIPFHNWGYNIGVVL
jgi:hypothetical protein